MPLPPNRLARASRHLEIVEEAWKTEHAAAMRCRDLEDCLAELTAVFELIQRVVQRRRDLVFRGEEAPNHELDKAEKELYARWLTLADQMLPELEAIEDDLGAGEEAACLRTCRKHAGRFLEQWAPAVLSRAVGLRVLEFDEEDADQIQALLESPPGAPGRPTRLPRPVPREDSSVLP